MLKAHVENLRVCTLHPWMSGNAYTQYVGMLCISDIFCLTSNDWTLFVRLHVDIHLAYYHHSIVVEMDLCLLSTENLTFILEMHTREALSR